MGTICDKFLGISLMSFPSKELKKQKTTYNSPSLLHHETENILRQKGLEILMLNVRKRFHKNNERTEVSCFLCRNQIKHLKAGRQTAAK